MKKAKKNEVTMADLARQLDIVAHAVASLENRIIIMDDDVKNMEARLTQKISALSNRLDDVILHYAKKEDLHKLESRVAVLEKR